MKERYNWCGKIDLIVLNNINYHTEWLLGAMGQDGEHVEEFVYENDDLTGTQVANASRVNEPIIYTGRQKAKKLTAADADASKEAMAREVVVEDVEK